MSTSREEETREVIHHDGDLAVIAYNDNVGGYVAIRETANGWKEVAMYPSIMQPESVIDHARNLMGMRSIHDSERKA